MEEQTTKVCKMCKLPVAIENFGNNKSQPDGKHWYCKPCGKIAAKRNRDRRKDKAAKKELDQLIDKTQHLSPAAQKLAREIHDSAAPQPPQPILQVEREGCFTPESCKVYVKRLREQRQRMGGSFHALTARSLAQWEKRLIALTGQEAFDKFIFEEGV